MKRIENEFHKCKLHSRLDQLYLEGQTVITWEELYLWYGVQKIAAATYRDIDTAWTEYAQAVGLGAREWKLTVFWKRTQGDYAAIFRRPMLEKNPRALSELTQNARPGAGT